jgi:4-hydroxy-2-oxoheptanedioate aldolase
MQDAPMLVRRNRVKEKLRNGEVVLGVEVWTRDARMIDLVGATGFDYAHIENEHVGQDWETVERSIRAAEAAGLAVVYRCEQCVADQPPVNEIIKALKLGAQIIMLPQVETKEAAERAVRAMKYPPRGERGFAPLDRSSAVAAGAKGPRGVDLRAVAREANEETMLWVIIESPRAVANIDEILSVDGLDGAVMGGLDYVLAAGLDSPSAPELAQATQTVAQALKRHGKHMVTATYDPGIIPEQRRNGNQIFLLGTDLVHMDTVLRGLVKHAHGN